jgi:sialic acid synthase SpsE/RimJ/RimL family protein N-acetyltransferase
VVHSRAVIPVVTIGHRRVGPGEPVYLIAEAGSNHNGDFDQALRLIDVAADAGADAVKFQTFRADKLYPRNAGVTKYLKVPKSIHEIIRELEMPFEWIAKLAAHCQARGVDFLSTPFDEEAADALDPFVPCFKIASYEMTHHTLVQHCARKGKPLIVSTGTATLGEVREVVAAVHAVGATELVVLQCTAKYPAPIHTLNLRAMTTIARELGVLVGLSDHSREPLPGPMAAVALGACVIEKHFTLANNLPGPDHAYALEPAELTALVENIRHVEKSLGTGIKEPPPEEQELRQFARRSLFTWQDVAEGAALTTRNLAALRCGELPYGLHPRELVRVLGCRTRRALSAGSSVRADDVAPLRLQRDDVVLRPLASEDADAIVRWRGRPDVADEMFSERPPTRAEHDQWFATLQRRTDRIELVILVENTPAGTIGLSNVDFGAHTAELGILIGEPSFRGRGVARHSCEALLEHAFDALGLSRVDVTLFADNASARRLYERLGFGDARQLSPRTKNGRMRPVEVMSLSKQGAAR